MSKLSAQIAMLRRVRPNEHSMDGLAMQAEQLEKRIKKLEKENLILKAHYCLNELEGHIDKIMLDKAQKIRDLEQQIKGINAIQEDIETVFEFSMCSIEDIIHYKILAIRSRIDEVKHNAKL